MAYHKQMQGKSSKFLWTNPLIKRKILSRGILISGRNFIIIIIKCSYLCFEHDSPLSKLSLPQPNTLSRIVVLQASHTQPAKQVGMPWNIQFTLLSLPLFSPLTASGGGSGSWWLVACCITSRMGLHPLAWWRGYPLRPLG